MYIGWVHLTKLEYAMGQGEAPWVEEAGGEGKAAGVEEAGPGEAVPALPRKVTELNMNWEKLGKLLMKRFDRKFLRLLKKFCVENELRKDRKTFDEKVW